MDTFFKIFGWTMAAFLGGTILYAIFWGGTSGAFFVLFLIGAGLLGGGKARRRTPPPPVFGADPYPEGPLPSPYEMMHSPRYASQPGNDHYLSYMQNRRK